MSTESALVTLTMGVDLDDSSNILSVVFLVGIDFGLPEENAEESEIDAYQARVEDFLKMVLRGRRGENDGTRYKKFLLDYGPRFSNAKVWKHETEKTAKDLLTVADEAFGILVVENITHPWIRGLPTTSTRWSLPSRLANSPEAFGGGWKREAFVRFAELKNDVEQDRKSTEGVEFERRFWFDVKQKNAKRQKRCSRLTAPLKDKEGNLVDINLLCGVDSDDDQASVADVEENDENRSQNQDGAQSVTGREITQEAAV